MQGVRSRLLRRTAPGKSGLLYVGEMHGENNLQPKMDHLVCFLPGAMTFVWLFVWCKASCKLHNAATSPSKSMQWLLFISYCHNVTGVPTTYAGSGNP